MKKMKQWINGLSVRGKLVFYGYLTITPVLVLLCIALLIYNYQKVLDERLSTNLSGVNALAESIEVLQTDIKDFSTYICINNEIHNLLTTAEEIDELNKDAKLWFEMAPMQIVQDMIALKGHIKTIAIYPSNGIRPYLRGMDGSVYLPDMEQVKKTEIYQETIQSSNGMLWKQIPKGDKEVYLSNRNDKIVLCREIFDMTQKKTLGYIVIGFGQDRLEKLCGSIVDEDAGVIVLDEKGGELCRVGNVAPQVVEYLNDSEFINQNYHDRESHFICGDYDIVCTQREKNSSIVCKITPKYGFCRQFLDIANMPLTLLLGILLGLLPLLLIISNTVTKPLQKVNEAIRKFSEGDFQQRVEVETEDEIGQVAKCFNSMVESIRTLIDENYVITLQEKESELAVLQAQINPHFLYNTLDSLYWQAIEEENEEIAESILALSQLFRLVLNQGKSEVTVGQETELISRYLQIQKMRFSKRLNYKIYMEESVKKMRIPKLILQPFVENAIVHGFENVTTPCYLEVSGRRENSWLRFQIRDTGIGMRQDQIDAVWEEEQDNYAKQRIGRYAIKNIRERLRLKYHENFKLEIQSDVGKGTTVTLIIPCEEEECGTENIDCRG